MTGRVRLPDPQATAELAAALVAALPALPAGWLILLQGELGAGKSTLARGMLRALGHDGPVPSPTYTLVEPYRVGGLDVYHVDLYRIGSPEELEFLGWAELDDGLRLIEWPERVPALAASADLLVELTYGEDRAGDGRQARLEGLSGRGREVLAALSLPLTAEP